MRRALLLLPFVVPFLFHAAYQPVNVAWTVRRFGCGCPPVTAPGASPAWHFNANDFNLLLWCGVAGACGLSWWLLVRREFADRRPPVYFAVQGSGLAVLVLICGNRLAWEIWL